MADLGLSTLGSSKQRERSLRQHARLVILSLLLLSLGCETWHAQQTDVQPLSLPRMSVDSTVVDVAFVRVPADQRQLSESIWREIDELAINQQVRTRMRHNGIRLGVAPLQLPPALRELLDEQTPASPEQGLSQEQLEQGAVAHRQRIHSRAGKPSKIVTRSVSADPQVFLTCLEGKVKGELLEQAQCQLIVKTFPLGDGRVRLELTPQVEHGDNKTRYVGQQGVWTLDASRQVRTFESLTTEVIVSPGQSLVVAGTAPPRGIGERFFELETNSGVGERILLIRIQQTQRDDIFELE